MVGVTDDDDDENDDDDDGMLAAEEVKTYTADVPGLQRASTREADPLHDANANR